MMGPTWPVLLLAISVLFGIAAAYPHRTYREDIDGPAKEESVRHIDGLGDMQRPQTSQELEDFLRHMESQAKANGGQWNMKYSAYSSHTGGSAADAAGGAAVRATITGEAINGEGGITGFAANCRNCKMRIRKVGSGGSTGSYGSSSGTYGHSSGTYGAGYGDSGDSAAGEMQNSQSRYYSRKTESASGLGIGEAGHGSSGTYGAGYGDSGDSTAREMQNSQSRYYSRKTESVSGLGMGEASHGTTSALANLEDLEGIGATRVTQGAAEGGLARGYGTSSNSRVVKTTVVKQSGGYSDAGDLDMRPVKLSDLDDADSQSSSRKEVKVTKSSWNIADLGSEYETSDMTALMRRLEEDLRSGKFQNGKTVTTVTTSESVNGAPPVVHKETFVKDGFDTVAPLEHGSMHVGQAEIEDLMRKLQQEIDSGNTHSGKTVTTVVTSTALNGGAPVVKKETFVKDGFDATPDLGDTQDTYGGARQVVKTTHTRKVYTSAVRGTGAEGSDLASASFAPRGVDHLGGGNLVRTTHSQRNVTTGGSSHETRRVDALGGGHLIRQTGDVDSQGTYSTSGKDTRRVDRLGDGHLIRELDDTQGAGVSGQAATFTTSMKETRRVDRLGNAHLIRETEQPDLAGSASTYGVGSYGSAGTNGGSAKDTRRVDALGGGHLIRDVPTAPMAPSVSVTQMKGYRKSLQPEDIVGGYTGSSSSSKYYSTFQSGAATPEGVPRPLSVDQQDLVGGSTGHVEKTSSSSSYRKTVSYDSSGDVSDQTRDLDRLGGGHLLRDTNSQVIKANTDHSQGTIERQIGQGSSSYQRTVSGSGSAGSRGIGAWSESGQSYTAGLDDETADRSPTESMSLIDAERGASRIPEASSGSYFSSGSSYQKSGSVSGISSVNPAAPVGPVTIPVRPSAFEQQTLIQSDLSGSGKSERRVDRLGGGQILKRGEGESGAAGTSYAGGSASRTSTSYTRKVEWTGDGEALEPREDLPSGIPPAPSHVLGFGSGGGSGSYGSSQNRHYQSSSSYGSGGSGLLGSYSDAVKGGNRGIYGGSYGSSSYGLSPSYGSYGSGRRLETQYRSEGSSSAGSSLQGQRMVMGQSAGPDCEFARSP